MSVSKGLYVEGMTDEEKDYLDGPLISSIRPFLPSYTGDTAHTYLGSPPGDIDSLDRQVSDLTYRVADLESFLTYAANVHPEMVTEYTVWLRTKRAMGVK